MRDSRNLGVFFRTGESGARASDHSLAPLRVINVGHNSGRNSR
jgi:hypothetical protein